MANNLSHFGSPLMDQGKQHAIQAAIETEGRGYLGFHATADNQNEGWFWLNHVLYPLNFRGHGPRATVPVYKHLAEAKHILLEGVLAKGTTLATTPDEIGTAGNEKLSYVPVPTRMMRNECYRFGRQIADDPAFKDKVTILLKFDPRSLSEAELETQYRRKGGNLYSYLYKVGAGMTSYIYAGHENDELLDPNTGFDGGVGDFDRYVAQTLFFLAGYDTTACDNSCNGLPVINAQNHLPDPPPFDPPLLTQNPKAIFLANQISFNARGLLAGVYFPQNLFFFLGFFGAVFTSTKWASSCGRRPSQKFR